MFAAGVILLVGTPALAAPLITLSPASGAIGTRVAVTASNFESYRGDNVSVFFDDVEITGSMLAVPQSGSFDIYFNVPDNVAPGKHEVRVRSEAGTTLARSSFTVPEDTIRLSLVEGTVGTTITISGTGFYASRTVTFYYYGRITEKLGTEVAGPTGEVSFTFTVPKSSAGKHRVRAENTEGNLAEADFRVIPRANLNLASAAGGQMVTVSGFGFAARSYVGIFFGNNEVTYASTDENGSFEVSFNVPEVKPGVYDVKALDGEDNTARESFNVTAGASLSQTIGPVGTELTVKGTGFAVGAVVTVLYDSVTVAEATTDNDGAFSSNFNIPPGHGGQHLVSITDGTTSRQLSFIVESQAPPIPAPLLPVDGSETKSRAYLDWTDVTDPSLPVTYKLQIASDQNFASLAVQKEALTGSEYTLAEDEELAAVTRQTYYWRIKAVDSAANESEWSAAWSFYITAPAVPVLLSPQAGLEAPSQTQFNWDDAVSGDLPVTYTLQIAHDAAFKSIVLEKKGLTESQYTLTEKERLAAVRQDAPYYWRVKAVHSSSVQSEWSAPSSFHVGLTFTLPLWLLYTLIAVGALLIGFFAFRLGRRTAYYR